MSLSIVRHLEQKNEVADILRRARALIGTPERWCKHALEKGKAYCVLGAINAAESGSPYGSGDSGAKQQLCSAIGQPDGFLTPWNNDPERTHAEVLAAFDLAIALADGRRRPAPQEGAQVTWKTWAVWDDSGEHRYRDFSSSRAMAVEWLAMYRRLYPTGKWRIARVTVTVERKRKGKR